MNSSTERAFTLVELMVAVAVGSLVTVAVFAFASQQVRSRSVTELRLETEQNARVAMDAIRADLQQSGLGLGYLPDGRFAGLVLGSFGPFRSNDHDHGAGIFSDDLRIRGAEGPVRTIVEDLNPSDGRVEVCSSDGAFEPGRLALLMDQHYFRARAVHVDAVTAQPCSGGVCVGTGNDCELVQFTDRSIVYSTGPSALTASFAGGSFFFGFFDVIYFLDHSGPDPELYRSEWPCGASPPAARSNCVTPQNLLAEGIESLQYRLRELTAPGTFSDMTADAGYLAAGGVTSDNRLQVEVELIARSRVEKEQFSPNQVCSQLRPASCFPAGGMRDRFGRRVFHTAVELKNSGIMKFRAR
jgi:prepilin-type N-terminal cleavage/methylation domain-containing protein